MRRDSGRDRTPDTALPAPRGGTPNRGRQKALPRRRGPDDDGYAPAQPRRPPTPRGRPQAPHRGICLARVAGGPPPTVHTTGSVAAVRPHPAISHACTGDGWSLAWAGVRRVAFRTVTRTLQRHSRTRARPFARMSAMQAIGERLREAR